MKNLFFLLVFLLTGGISKAQNENQFFQSLPAGYQVNDGNGKRGPYVEEDFDKDGIKDLVVILFEKKRGLPIFCIYLSSVFNTSRTIMYCDWIYFFHDMHCENGIVNIFSDSGSMGQYGTMKLKYDESKKSMVVINFENEVGAKTIQFEELKY